MRQIDAISLLIATNNSVHNECTVLIRYQYIPSSHCEQSPIRNNMVLSAKMLWCSHILLFCVTFENLLRWTLLQYVCCCFISVGDKLEWFHFVFQLPASSLWQRLSLIIKCARINANKPLMNDSYEIHKFHFSHLHPFICFCFYVSCAAPPMMAKYCVMFLSKCFAISDLNGHLKWNTRLFRTRYTCSFGTFFSSFLFIAKMEIPESHKVIFKSN